MKPHSEPSETACCLLNAGPGSWVFEEIAGRLARAIGVPVRDSPAARVYLLGWDEPGPPPGAQLFIPFDAIRAAGDKRLLASLFAAAGVPTPATHLAATAEEARALLAREPEREWALKWPTGCGATGHRLLAADGVVPKDWPRPYIVQEFIRLARPEVYRLYAVAGELFGWNVRRFPPGARTSPWVAHARGARYEVAGEAPVEAAARGRAALAAAGLLDSFGCVDLLCAPGGEWLVLEVGTDGIFTCVDRDVDIPGAAEAIDRRIAAAFHAWAGRHAA